jgi:uncharacterized protein YigA (DUF484 family)
MATVKELEGIMTEIQVTMKEEAEARKKSRKELDVIMKELAEAHKETEAAIKSLTESQKVTEASLDSLSKTVNHWVGRFGNTTGYITEMIIVPGIRKKMNEHGHHFESLAARKEFYRKDGSIFTEVDLILENDKEIMIVEIKTHLTKDEVEHHVKRLKRLRKGEKEAKIEDKSLIAAVAGLSVDKDAKEMAKELGMYVIQITESDKNIRVQAPAKGVGRW